MNKTNLESWVSHVLDAEKLQGDLGQDLRDIRNKAGFTLAQMSDMMKVSKAYLSDVERGKRKVTLSVAVRYLAI